MRIGIIGPAGDAAVQLSSAIDLVLRGFGADEIIYLGADSAVDRLAASYSLELAGGSRGGFEDRVLELAEQGSPAELRAALGAEVEMRRLDALRILPPPPARAIEMLDDRFILFVHDKATLDEDDIANAQVIIYSQSKQWLFRRFGPRAFFTPGPLAEGHVGIIETDVDGRLTITAHKLDGTPVLRESLVGRSAKMSVSA